MITQQDRSVIDVKRSTSMLVASTTFSSSEKLIHIRVYVDNSDNEILITPFELKSWLEKSYHNGDIKLTDDLDDQLYFLFRNRFHNRDYIFEITQDGNTGYLIKYPSINY